MENVIILLEEQLLSSSSKIEQVLKALRERQLDGQISWLDESLAYLDGVVFAKVAGTKTCTALKSLPGIQSIHPDATRRAVDDTTKVSRSH